MKTLTCSLLILSLALLVSTASYAQEETDIETLRAADVNSDGIINILDLVLLASHFGETVAEAQTPNPDVNGDGSVNILDLVRVANHLGETVRPPVAFVSADPESDVEITTNDSITLTFDNPPADVTVSTGFAITDGNSVAITGPFTPGDLELTITWADGTETLSYTIRPLVAFVSIAPAIDTEMTVDGSIIATFDNPPADVTVSEGTASIDGNSVTIEGPFTPGALELTMTWKDGTEIFTYTVTAPDTEAPSITGGTVSDGDTDVNPSAAIEIEFSEEVRGLVTLRTEADDNVGWITTFDGNKVMLTPVAGKELDPETRYVITVKVKDAADNRTDINITFTTGSAYDGIPIEVTDANFDTVVIESKLPVVVESYKDG